jgi:hypothetical protein
LRIKDNRISTLSALDPEKHPKLEYLNLKRNNISDQQEISGLKRMSTLLTIHLADNPFYQDISGASSPIEEQCMFDIKGLNKERLWVIFQLPFIRALDNIPVTFDEQVTADNVFAPSTEFLTSLQYNLLLRNQVKQAATLNLKPALSMEIYTPIVFCGRKGAGKRTFAKKIQARHTDKFELCCSYTNRKPRENEINGRDYRFIDDNEMEEIFQRGEFVEIMKVGSYRYGITVECIDEIAQRGKFCLLCFELEGAILMKKAGITCKIAYLTTEDTQEGIFMVVNE